MLNAKLVTFLGLGSLWLPLAAQESVTLGRDRAPAGGIRASLLLDESRRRGNGAVREMAADDIFYSGEKFRLKLRSDREGYVYVLLRDTQGRAQLMYPAAEDLNDGDNRIERNQTQSLPARSFFRFDENPGTERVWVIVSQRPIADLDRAARDNGEIRTEQLQQLTVAGSEAKGIDRSNDREDDQDQPRNQKVVVPMQIVHLPR